MKAEAEPTENVNIAAPARAANEQEVKCRDIGVFSFVAPQHDKKTMHDMNGR